MPRETTLKNTTCIKGHIHPPWNTTGALRIAKCESICGFCRKEMKTAASLRKHVAIHIKHELPGLKITESSSGRGRLELPLARSESSEPSSSRVFVVDEDEAMNIESTSSQISTVMTRGHHLPLSPNFSAHISTPFSPSAMNLNGEQTQPPHSTPSSRATTFSPSPPFIPSSHLSPLAAQPLATSRNQPVFSHNYESSIHRESTGLYESVDPYKYLRTLNLSTKSAWTVIPAREGFRILDLCKSLSEAPSAADGSIPCYNRETIFDEEWQAHMKDVHGVFLLWPETWMKRIEVLDLDAFGGDIVAVNGVIMDS